MPTATTTASCASTVLASLSETQRIGQLFAVGLADDRSTAAERHAIQAHGFGSWWFTKQTSVGTAAIRKVADAIQAEATDDATGGIGSFVAANQEGGLIQALSGPGFDRSHRRSPRAPGRRRGSATPLPAGVASRKAGVNLDFAPLADVVPRKDARENAPIGQLEREYGFAPSVVADHVEAFIDGMNAAGVVTTASIPPVWVAWSQTRISAVASWTRSRRATIPTSNRSGVRSMPAYRP